MGGTLAIIGAGAAGCFCAIEAARLDSGLDIVIYESGPKPLAKVAVTGGGRCNFTNSFEFIEDLSKAYPRGHRLISRAFRVFDPEDTVRWFASEGVPSVTQDDGCVFPRSQDAMQIVRTLENLMRRNKVRVQCACRVEKIETEKGKWILRFADGGFAAADSVLLTSGGSSRQSLEKMLPETVKITDTVPSLFTFKIADSGLRSLMGTVVEGAILSLAGTRFRSEGTLLVTDWGLSGPATLKLSSYSARQLASCGWKAALLVNWLGMVEDDVRSWLEETAGNEARKFVSSIRPDGISDRLWKYLLLRSGLPEGRRWSELGSKGKNRLVSVLTADNYSIDGRARFKEEFVTCGGVDLSGINQNTLESKTCPGLFFAGEVLDVDAITGGFNLQAAWSTAMVAAKSITNNNQ